MILKAATGGTRFIADVFGKAGKLDTGSTNTDSSGGLGGTGPYDPNQVRADLEAVYGKENVSSSTIAPSIAPNAGLAGQRHPVTGVVFDNRGFPIFDDIASYDTRIGSTGSRTSDQRAATRQLRDAIDNGSVNSSQFSSTQLAAIKSGSSRIPGLTWHHHQDSGRMQLINSLTHSRTAHAGGVAVQKGP